MPSDPEDSTENPLADSPPKDEDEDLTPILSSTNRVISRPLERECAHTCRVRL